MDVQTYLFFDGNCAEALEFYARVFGMSVDYKMTFAQGAPQLAPPGWEDKVFHATGSIGTTRLNFADSQSEPGSEFARFALLAHVDSDTEAERVFAALLDGGEIKMPLQPTFWAPRYGIVKDRFGVTWKVQASAQQ